MLNSMRPDPAQYDSFAHEYAAHAETAPYNALYDRPATLGVLGDVAGKRVLDAACGPGLYLGELLERGAEVVACDASEQMTALARRRAGERAEVRVHRLEDRFDWLADGSVDVALSALAYHYLNDRPAFLAEMHRVLAPGGSLVISTHHPASDWARLGGSYFEEGSLTETWSRGWEVTTWRVPLTKLCAEFAEAGFVIERLVEPRPDPRMATSHPDAWEKLSNAPAFIIFRLRPA